MTLSVALLLFWNAVLTVLLLWLGLRFFRLGKGVKERNVVAVLERELRRREQVEKDLVALKSEAARLQERTQKSLQCVGVVRFNPYNDVGGDQSFAVALLDGEGDGLVFSSLHGREETRVYAKPVKKGEAQEYSLSGEEKEAIKVARR